VTIMAKMAKAIVATIISVVVIIVVAAVILIIIYVVYAPKSTSSIPFLSSVLPKLITGNSSVEKANDEDQQISIGKYFSSSEQSSSTLEVNKDPSLVSRFTTNGTKNIVNIVGDATAILSSRLDNDVKLEDASILLNENGGSAKITIIDISKPLKTIEIWFKPTSSATDSHFFSWFLYGDSYFQQATSYFSIKGVESVYVNGQHYTDLYGFNSFFSSAIKVGTWNQIGFILSPDVKQSDSLLISGTSSIIEKDFGIQGYFGELLLYNQKLDENKIRDNFSLLADKYNDVGTIFKTFLPQ
jgi:hypothetical protein